MGTTADYSILSSDVTFSLLFCSYARQLHDMPADPTNNHLHITHWMALYNCVFSRAWRSREVSELLVRYYPHWTVHRRLREVDALRSDVINLTEICPHSAFVFALKDHAIFRGVPRTAEITRVLPEFSVATRKGTDVQMPVIIVEHVLTINNPQEREKHLAHLSAALRSALALWEIHHISAAVLGFLVEQNIVSTVVGWMTEDKECFVSEVSDYTFDMSLPHDAFRFFTLLQTPGSERFAEHMQETVALSREEAMEALLDPGYVSWKSIHWSHLDKGNGEGPDTHGWRVDVAKSMAD
ncbi:hypothetical protein CPB85DRAFT_1563380 [Mucidula mucida]|nr:hypothetical protein CPB85DRAFT_1563380 [Mucidula mucida]